MSNAEMNLPWKYQHAEGLNDYDHILDSKGNEICTVYAIFGNGKEKYVEHILNLANAGFIPVEVEATNEESVASPEGL